MHHHFIRAADVKPTPAFPKHAKGYRRFALSDRSVGAASVDAPGAVGIVSVARGPS
jgi:hypothetical protein